MVYIAIRILNPHVQRVQNMCGKGGYRVSKAKLQTAEVDPYSSIAEMEIFLLSQF